MMKILWIKWHLKFLFFSPIKLAVKRNEFSIRGPVNDGFVLFSALDFD